MDELIGPDTVNTMPEETIMAYQDHGDPQPRLQRGLDEAHRVFEELERAGVDYDDVTDTLEREGVEKFSASFEELHGVAARQAGVAGSRVIADARKVIERFFETRAVLLADRRFLRSPSSRVTGKRRGAVG